MSRLLESIYLKDGQFRNLSYHLVRMKKSSRILFGNEIPGSFDSWFAKEEVPSKGLYKCRIIYQTAIERIEFVPYEVRAVRTLKLITDNSISYPHKFLDRKSLLDLFEQRGEADDIIIVRNEEITDSSYANLVFKKNGEWFTPVSCLLEGTMRKNLLQEDKIKEVNIQVKDLFRYESCKLINSMLGIDTPEIDIRSILK